MVDDAPRIDRQIAFLTAADGLKHVNRANVALAGARFENTAEHSWHIALWAMVFAGSGMAPDGLDLGRVISTALLHDLVEVYAGDHPIFEPHDADAVRLREAEAADRLYGLLPADQGAALRGLWREYEDRDTPEARFVRLMDDTQPMFQELANTSTGQTERDIFRSILETGRFARMKNDWPEIYAETESLFFGRGHVASEALDRRLRFLAEADQLKSVLRGTTIFDGSRRENSAEHSWHICLFALVLAEHANRDIRLDRVLQMLVLHDLVEIDAGDAPIHGDHDPEALAAREQAAADRLFGLLPPAQGISFRAIWDEFEAAETDDAIFAKSIDRVQPVLANLNSGGGTWPTYRVTAEQLETRVGHKVCRGAPAVWHALKPRIDDWFRSSDLWRPRS